MNSNMLVIEMLLQILMWIVCRIGIYSLFVQLHSSTTTVMSYVPVMYGLDN
jgi:hypothetical protein